jgi:fructoselysine-6-P-deglycase FrlB-like protein
MRVMQDLLAQNISNCIWVSCGGAAAPMWPAAAPVRRRCSARASCSARLPARPARLPAGSLARLPR